MSVIKSGYNRAIVGTFLVGQEVEENYFTIVFYQNTAEDKVVDKTSYLNEVLTVHGSFQEDSSVILMNIRLQLKDVPNFNYAYIEAFKRYYYVTDIVSLSNGMWEITLNIDILMSYKDGIKNLTAFVDRQENDYNTRIIDPKIVMEQHPNITTYEINNDVFDLTYSKYCFVINGYAIKGFVD